MISVSPFYTTSKRIKPFISQDLQVVINHPIRFLVSGSIAHGYPEPLLVDLCNVVLTAQDAGVLQKQQSHIATQCESLVRNLARVGIIALVDEATGYQEIRAQRALATILEKYIAEALQPWTKTFPYTFYEQIYRLRGWPGFPPPGKGGPGPRVMAHYTTNFVYERLAPGVLDEFRKKNPTQPATKTRKHKHHQWFTPDFGHPQMKEHSAAVTALMCAAPNWGQFQHVLDKPSRIGIIPCRCPSTRREPNDTATG